VGTTKPANRKTGSSPIDFQIARRMTNGVQSRRVTSGGQDMKASWLYRIASVLLLLFAIGHTLGFRQNNPEWGVGSVIDSMRSIHFDAQGFSRTYWDFFSAFGFFFSVFLLFAAVLTWQLAGLPVEIFARMRGTAWALAICFAAVTALSWRYAFTTPIVFSVIITMCLIAAPWFAAKKPL